MKKEKKDPYEFDQSPFYQLRSKKKLSKLLGFESNLELSRFVQSGIKYNKFQIDTGKKRTIEYPVLKLFYVHQKIYKLLSRLKSPPYLHSGVKGRSYITNAKAHLNNHPLATLDIKSFFPSTKKRHIYEFFRFQMECSSDISNILSTICCNEENHLPTGSCISQPLSFLSHKSMFDHIYENSLSSGITMTCYVDDLTFSGSSLKKGWVFENVKKIIHRRGLSYHKEKFYRADQPKLVTGVILHRGVLKVRNSHHYMIYKKRRGFSIADASTSNPKPLRSLIGLMNAAGQIDPRFKNLAKNTHYRIKNKFSRTK